MTKIRKKKFIQTANTKRAIFRAQKCQKTSLALYRTHAIMHCQKKTVKVLLLLEKWRESRGVIHCQKKTRKLRFDRHYQKSTEQLRDQALVEKGSKIEGLCTVIIKAGNSRYNILLENGGKVKGTTHYQKMSGKLKVQCTILKWRESRGNRTLLKNGGKVEGATHY